MPCAARRVYGDAWLNQRAGIPPAEVVHPHARDDDGFPAHVAARLRAGNSACTQIGSSSRAAWDRATATPIVRWASASIASRARYRGWACEPGERVATFSWNHYRHLELYFAVPMQGAVLHTLNIRLFHDQLTYIVNHAADRFIVVDRSLLPVVQQAGADL